MPQPERASLLQCAVLWAHEKAGGNDQFGQPLLGAPVQIPVRWENTKREFARPDGTTVTFDAQVFTDRFVRPYSVLWLGRLKDLPAGTDFHAAKHELFRVTACDGIPDIRNRIGEYELLLAR
jgi:hypothetical protein